MAALLAPSEFEQRKKALTEGRIDGKASNSKTMANEVKNSAGVTFAVIETGGKQYKVAAGDSIRIEKLSGDFKQGDVVTFDKVLLQDDGTNTTVGAPYIAGAKVEAEITEAGRAKKIEVIKYKAKSRYFKLRGHRQPYMKVKIVKI